MNGAAADVRLGSLTIGAGNSSDTVRVDSGAVVVTNEVLIGHTSNTRWEILQINGGSFTSLDPVYGIVLSQNNGTTANNSELYLSGGTTTTEKLCFGIATDTVGGNGFLIVNGGSLYLGSGGIVQSNTAGYAATISLTNGLVGAKADWSSRLPVRLTGNSFTLRAADVSGTAHDIALSGAVSGTASLIKNGAGTLTLSGTNSYGGSTTVAEGKLTLNGPLTSTNPVLVASGATLGGTGSITARPPSKVAAPCLPAGL